MVDWAQSTNSVTNSVKDIHFSSCWDLPELRRVVLLPSTLNDAGDAASETQAGSVFQIRIVTGKELNLKTLSSILLVSVEN